MSKNWNAKKKFDNESLEGYVNYFEVPLKISRYAAEKLWNVLTCAEISFLVLTIICLGSYLFSVEFKCPYGELDPCRKWFTDEGGIIKLLIIGAPGIFIINYLCIIVFFTRRVKVSFSQMD